MDLFPVFFFNLRAFSIQGKHLGRYILGISSGDSVYEGPSSWTRILASMVISIKGYILDTHLGIDGVRMMNVK